MTPPPPALRLLQRPARRSATGPSPTVRPVPPMPSPWLSQAVREAALHRAQRLRQDAVDGFWPRVHAVLKRGLRRGLQRTARTVRRIAEALRRHAGPRATSEGRPTGVSPAPCRGRP